MVLGICWRVLGSLLSLCCRERGGEIESVSSVGIAGWEWGLEVVKIYEFSDLLRMRPRLKSSITPFHANCCIVTSRCSQNLIACGSAQQLFVCRLCDGAKTWLPRRIKRLEKLYGREFKKEAPNAAAELFSAAFRLVLLTQRVDMDPLLQKTKALGEAHDRE